MVVDTLLHSLRLNRNSYYEITSQSQMMQIWVQSKYAIFANIKHIWFGKLVYFPSFDIHFICLYLALT